MVIAFEMAAMNMIVAMLCGALIGSERQLRQRMAGLRTNALVAMGAASFVVFSQLYPDELSPTRVGAQVVSGIGFLGAGIIFRHGFSVHGLNTAATLWCSAAVGVISGAGAWPLALFSTGLIMFINVGLRPLVRLLKRKTKMGSLTSNEHHFITTFDRDGALELKPLILAELKRLGFEIVGFETSSEGEDHAICLDVLVVCVDGAEVKLREMAVILMPHPHVQSVQTEAVLDV